MPVPAKTPPKAPAKRTVAKQTVAKQTMAKQTMAKQSSAKATSKPVAKPAKRTTARAKAVKPLTSARLVRTRSRGKVRLRPAAYRSRGRVVYSPWKEPTFVNDSTDGDVSDGEDPVVRQAAIDALGQYNGTVVVADPFSGRILTIVNQKLALKSGFIPCSTVKILTAFAALSEGIVDRGTFLRLSRYKSMNLTEALAVSNNPYFAVLGEKLGFDRVIYYSRLFGFGEKAGLNIAGEQAGILPTRTPPEGVGMMTSFGSGISLTPLGLAGVLSTIANGGTLYYLQHPRSAEEAEAFVPRVKRHLDIERFIPEVKPGLEGAVEYGTARRAGSKTDETILGKTGTCTDERSPTHMGWFGSYNESSRNKLVVVVMLTGGRPVNGPVASGVAGAVYRNLSHQDYFADADPTRTGRPGSLVKSACCVR
ncbi:MAG: penicillin-binding transpeptidase domain-containing protein [Bryobacteraceae bacterium]|nr:penicillin-binding transpeptidase domain-containing protein [Bryobacteraceae bacterium]